MAISCGRTYAISTAVDWRSFARSPVRVAGECDGEANAASPPAESQVFAETVRSVVVVLDWDKAQRQGQIGSGIVVGRDRVVTQCRAIRKVRNLGVKQGGMRARARLAHADNSREVCELEILPPGHFDRPSYQVRPVREIAIGDPIYAFPALPDEVGVPIRGNVSAVRPYGKDKAIQVSNKLSSSYAGGPWFDKSGALVGITILRSQHAEDASFIYPAEYVLDAAYRATPVASQQDRSIIKQAAVVPRVDQGLEQPVAKMESESTRSVVAAEGTITNKTYLAQIVETSMNRLIYAKEVHEGGLSGTATIRFWLESGGRLRESFVETSSGYAALDVAALVAVRKAINETTMPDSVREHGYRGVVAIRHVEPATAAQSQ